MLETQLKKDMTIKKDGVDLGYFSTHSLLHAVSARLWRHRWISVLLFLSFLSALATYAAFNEHLSFGNDPNTVIWLLNLDFILLLCLVAMIAKRVVGLWAGQKRGLAGSDMHVRLVYTFSVLAAAPAIIMMVFSAFFFHFGIQSWFSESISIAVNESQAVAVAYLEEHKQVIRADTFAMANDINRQLPFLISNKQTLEKAVQTQSLFRNLSEVIIFEENGEVLARSGLTFSLEFENIPDAIMAQADAGEVAIMTGGNDDRVRALIKLNNLASAYLFVGRMIDPKVLGHVSATTQAAQGYADLQARYSRMQVLVMLIFLAVGLLLLFAAIGLGLLLARQLVSPISALVQTADRVRAGDLAARVPEQKTVQEFDYLAQSFNRMTSQIQEQQNELIEANRQLDQRRRFTETILEGVSSGVIGIDSAGVVNLANSSFCKLLNVEEPDFVGKAITDIMPAIEETLEKAHQKPTKITQSEIPIVQDGGRRRIFLVRVAIELIGERGQGAIVTFDDITDLQQAQRKAAWSDVARRIAHEIKNPLTPIQLSAERLRRKYLDQIKDGRDVFEQCTDTIIKHVGDIGHMVNEFSSFARMPEPTMTPDDLDKHIADTLFLHKQAHPAISFDYKKNKDVSYYSVFDAQQLRQALNNLIQNAVDSVTTHHAHDLEKGAINIILAPYNEHEFIVCVSDNGVGLPQEDSVSNLTEPYVTHKPKGTGLGLAIVKKIMEDHNGALILDTTQALKSLTHWQDLGGAHVSLVFARNQYMAGVGKDNSEGSKA